VTARHDPPIGRESLPPKGRQKRPPRYRETHELVGAIERMLDALGDRVAAEDPPDLLYFELLRARLKATYRRAVDGQRRSGFTDRDIGEALGIRRQSVEERWPRGSDRGGE
jgi:DNA-directed RNA polymerase specialized sigma24 family protein